MYLYSSGQMTKQRKVTDGRTDEQICRGYLQRSAMQAVHTRCNYWATVPWCCECAITHDGGI